MDPSILGVAVAKLIAKAALEKAGQTGRGAMAPLVDRVHGWFRRRRDTDGEQALTLVQAAPDSQRAIDGLAAALNAAARDDPAEAQVLAQQVNRIHAGGDEQVTTFIQQIVGNARSDRSVQAGVYHERGGA